MNQYKVSELTDKIKALLEDSFPGVIIVQGEVTELSRASSGHVYFSLKDDRSKIKAVFFKQYTRSDSFIPKNGDKINAIGELRLYAPDGSYQLIVRRMEYDSEGKFWKRFEEVKRKLQLEGLFEDKKVVPQYPRRVALLTAESGAAVKDFLITAANAGNFFDIDIWPIPVQGVSNAEAISKAIISAGKLTERYDILILSRGGGSLEDLAVFNEEVVARALKDSKVATISAIGHEQDVTICDFISDDRVATPTAAAVKVSSSYVEARRTVGVLENRLSLLLRWRWENAILDFDRVQAKLHSVNSTLLIERYYNRVDSLHTSLLSGLKLYTIKNSSRLSTIQRTLDSVDLLSKITRQKDFVDQLKSKLINYTKSYLSENTHKLNMTVQKLSLLNPDALLSKGYALVVNSRGGIVAGVGDVELEEELEIKLKDGYINTFVTGKRKF